MGRVRPILFNTGMVQAILAGRKTATRRVVMPHGRKKAKVQGYCQGNGLWVDPGIDNGDAEGHIKDYSVSPCWMSYSWYLGRYAPCLPGDILYVREAWAFLPCIECREEGRCGREPATHEDREAVSEGCYLYRAGYRDPGRITWNPSIHMPRAAARIWLEVKSVRVEKLRDIDAEGLKAEGFLEHSMDDLPSEYDRLAVKFLYEDAQKGFARLWDHTIPKGQQGLYGWEADPWVWVIGFERCRKPEG